MNIGTHPTQIYPKISVNVANSHNKESTEPSLGNKSSVEVSQLSSLSVIMPSSSSSSAFSALADKPLAVESSSKVSNLGDSSNESSEGKECSMYVYIIFHLSNHLYVKLTVLIVENEILFCFERSSIQQRLQSIFAQFGFVYRRK